MAKGYYLVCGDKTTCGGIITEGDITETIFRKATARESDRVTCGVHPGMYVIVGHVGNDSLRGRKYAGSLDSFSSCPCKARFIPSMLTHSYELSSVTASSASDTTVSSPESQQYGQSAKKVKQESLVIGTCRPEDNPLLNGVYIWTETTGAGHSFVSVHENNTIYLYTYGRYGRTGPADLTGDGILNFLKDEDARGYYRFELYRLGARVFQIDDANLKQTRDFFEKLWSSGKPAIQTPEMKEITKRRGRTIDKYDVTGNNCTTRSIEGIKAAGSKMFEISHVPITTKLPIIKGEEDFTVPISLQRYLIAKSSDLSSMYIVEVTKKFKEQYPNIDNLSLLDPSMGTQIQEVAAEPVSNSV
ncbi:PAAR domain-containing protein [Serratia oryzae]|uniref:PAAR domain-containing protein n=1 Tax=Serratia oryzae TaxID=2034155 RepID=UPI0012E2EF76|nr:PAAR domain-containing protein [Serratia oryzae]